MSKAEEIANTFCTTVIVVATLYFATIVAHAWIVGRFARVDNTERFERLQNSLPPNSTIFIPGPGDRDDAH